VNLRLDLPLAVGLLVTLLVGCAEEPQRTRESGVVASNTTVPLFAPEDPIQEIGEFLGGGDQTLDFVSGVTVLDDDRIAVVDQGPAAVFVFDAAGTRVESFGGKGDGPGEFRAPADIGLLPGDSIRILDAWDHTVSILGPDFAYARQMPAESPFLNRFLLEGALLPDERERAERALAGRDFPETGTGFRPVRLAVDSTVWIRERIGDGSEASLWIVLDAGGTPGRAVELPARFDPLFMDGEEVAGRWRGDYDVHYVRRYRLTPSGGSVTLPDWLEIPRVGSDAAPMPDSIATRFRAILRNAATEQEIHYSVHGTYTLQIDSIMRASTSEIPESIGFDVLHADERGWSMVLTSAGHSGLCAIRYGSGGPPTLRSGVVACSD